MMIIFTTPGTYYCIRPYIRSTTIKTQLEINRAPAMFMINPTTSIFENETPLTPPKAKPFTPVAMGLIKALVQESVIMISISRAGKPKVCAKGRATTKKLSWTAVLLSTSVQKEVTRAIKKNNANADMPVGIIHAAQPAKNSWMLKAYKIAASTTAMPTKRNPLVGRSL